MNNLRPVLIKGARVINPSTSLDSQGDILIVDGKILSCEANITPPDDTMLIEANGMVACPGFIDIHTHLREPGREDKETIEAGQKAAAKGGFTTITCMPNTEPAIDNAPVAEFINKKAQDSGIIRTLLVGAVSKARQGIELSEMEELANSGVVAFSDDGSPVATGHLMQMALTYSKELFNSVSGNYGFPIIDHCEDYSLTHGLGVHEGWVADRLGLLGYPSAGEEAIVARDIALAELTGGHFHAAHVSSQGSIDLIRQAKLRGIKVTAEVTPHHLTMSEEWVMGIHGESKPSHPLSLKAYDPMAKVSPPLRSIADQKALASALREGIIDCIATDHAPHTFSDKAQPFDEAAVGISVLETAFGSLMSLVHSGQLELHTLIHRLTLAPTQVLGLSNLGLGSISVGSIADVVLFDPELQWEVNPNDFLSKGKNTPLAGEILKGKVKLTIAKGRIVFDSENKMLDVRNSFA